VVIGYSGIKTTKHGYCNIYDTVFSDYHLNEPITVLPLATYKGIFQLLNTPSSCIFSASSGFSGYLESWHRKPAPDLPLIYEGIPNKRVKPVQN